MTLEEQYSDLTEFYESCLEVITSRQHDYAREGIPLMETLKSSAKSNITIEQSLYQLFHKQLSAWERFVHTGRLDSESIRSRLKDAANYVGLFHFYITRKEELHTAWASHYVDQPCHCHHPLIAVYGTLSNQCLRCCILTWLERH